MTAPMSLGEAVDWGAGLPATTTMAAISTITTATEMAATIARLPARLAAAYRARAQPQPRRPIGMASPLIHTRKLPHSTPRQAAGDRYESLPGCGRHAARHAVATLTQRW